MGTLKLSRGITKLTALLLCAAIILTGCQTAEPINVVEMLTGAQKYLTDMDYEQAIIEFNKVLEIDPMNVDAYIGLADAYIQLGDFDNAIKTLQQGYERTASNEIRQKLGELVSQSDGNNHPDSDSPISSETTITNEPADSEPVFGSMGSVTILGEEFDIATTTSLLIYNMEWYLKEDGCNPRLNDPEKFYADRTYQRPAIIYLTNDLSYSELENIAELANLMDLEIDYSGITDISPLTKLTNLRSLTLNYNNIDVSMLSKFTNLYGLDLQQKNIDDISALSALKNLTSLTLYDNSISDISALSELTNLTFLGLTGNSINEISALSKLTNLTTLCLQHMNCSDISALSGLTNLTHLEILDSSEVSDISALSGLTNLSVLRLNDNNISDISPLGNLTKLTYVELTFNQINDISPLFNLSNATYIDIRDNMVSSEDSNQLSQRLPNCDVLTDD